MMLNMDMPPSASAVPTVLAFASWDGSGHRRACPLATFGYPRDSPLHLTARLVCVDPPRADSAEVSNAQELAGSIALAVRGGCSFADKARRVQAAGAIAMVLANNTREEPDAAFTMAEDEVQPGSTPPSPQLSAIAIPCVMMCLLDVRELFQKFPPTAPQAGVLTLEVLGREETEEAAEEGLRIRQEMKVKYEEQQRRGGGGGGGGGWGVGSVLKRKTTALIKLLEPQAVGQQQTGNIMTKFEDTAAPTSTTTVDPSGPSSAVATVRKQTSDASSSSQRDSKPTSLVAFVQWAVSADAYQLEFAPLADFCRVSDGSVFDGPLVVCDPVLADDRIANAAALKGSIVLVKRGKCTFPAKLERVQRRGAVAAIVGNDDESDPTAAFVMSVDSIKTDHIAIPSVMVSNTTFQRLVADKAARIRILCVAPGPAAADLLARSGATSLIEAADQVQDGCEDLAVQEFHGVCRAGDYDACLHVMDIICDGNDAQERRLISNHDSNWRNALHHACTGGDDRIVKLLLEHGASPFDVDLTARTALHVSSAYGHAKCVEVLLQAASSSIQTSDDDDADGRLVLLNPDIGGSTPIHLATIAGSTDTLELLLTATAQVAEDGTYQFDGVNARNADGSTPLHLACRHEHAHCAVYLLAANADVNVVDSSGCTALAIACEMINDCEDGSASDLMFIIEKLIAADAAMEDVPTMKMTLAGLSYESSGSVASNGRLLLDRIDSPTVKREVEILYLRHQVQTLRSTLMKTQQGESKLAARVEALEGSIEQLELHDKTAVTATQYQHAIYTSQIDQLQCQMGSLLQLLRVNSDASRLVGGNCSDLSLVAAVSDSLFARSPGKLFADSDNDNKSVEERLIAEELHVGARLNGEGQRDEALLSLGTASQQELALDAGLARDLGKKLLRRRQFDLAEAYFVRSLEILPLPGVAQLRDKAHTAQQQSRQEAASTSEATVPQPPKENVRDQFVPGQVLSPVTKEAMIQRLITAVVNSGASEQVRKSLECEVNKLKALPCRSSEFELACKWLQWLTTLPWGDPATGLVSAASGWEPWVHASGSLNAFLELERLERDREHQDEDVAARKIQRVIRIWMKGYHSAMSREDAAAVKIQRIVRCWRRQRVASVKGEQPEGSDGSERAGRNVHNTKQKPLQSEHAEDCDTDAVDYNVEVDKAVLRKISPSRSVSVVTGTKLSGVGESDRQQQVRIVQLLLTQIRDRHHHYHRSTASPPRRHRSAEESTQFFVWTRWQRDQGGFTHSQAVLSGSYEDEDDARRRYERIVADESKRLHCEATAVDVPSCVTAAGYPTPTPSTASLRGYQIQRVNATSA